MERLVLMEKYNQERIASVNGLAAQVFAHSDPKKSAEFLSKFMDDIFPEISVDKEATADQKAKQLAAFSKQTIKLDPIPGYEDAYRLNIEEKVEENKGEEKK